MTQLSKLSVGVRTASSAAEIGAKRTEPPQTRLIGAWTAYRPDRPLLPLEPRGSGESRGRVASDERYKYPDLDKTVGSGVGWEIRQGVVVFYVHVSGGMRGWRQLRLSAYFRHGLAASAASLGGNSRHCKPKQNTHKTTHEHAH